MKVKECMQKEVCCVSPNSKISDVAKLMGDNHIGSIPVCDNKNNICGIVTDRDIILRCIACDKDAKNTSVSDIMSCNVCSCKAEDNIEDAEYIMSENQIRRLPVCDDNNHIIGILTIGDLANNDRDIGKQKIYDTISDICDSNGNKNAE